MWDKRYNQESYAYGKEPNAFLASVDLNTFNGKVLCLAEGEGRNAVYLAQEGFDVTAVDQSAVGLEKARKLAEERGVSIHTEQADLAEYHIEPAYWDGIVSIFGHFPPPLRRRIHGEAAKGLKSGGFLILEAYNKEQLAYGTGGPPVEDLLYSLEDLRADFGADFDFKIARETEREVMEGQYHNGAGAVVQIFAVKK